MDFRERLLENAKYQLALYVGAKEAFRKAYLAHVRQQLAAKGIKPGTRFAVLWAEGAQEYVLDEVFVGVSEWDGVFETNENIRCHPILKNGKVGKSHYYLKEKHIAFMRVAQPPA